MFVLVWALWWVVWFYCYLLVWVCFSLMVSWFLDCFVFGWFEVICFGCLRGWFDLGVCLFRCFGLYVVNFVDVDVFYCFGLDGLLLWFWLI